MATSAIRYPSERTLRRLARSGELTVPGFADLVGAALGPVAQPLLAVQKKNQGNHSTAKSGSGTPEPCLHTLAESLWNRTHVFSARAAELRGLLEPTLVWEPGRFLRLWLKLLPVEYGHEMVNLFQRTHASGHEDPAWGDRETGDLRRKRGQPPRPAIVPRSEAEGRRKHSGELQRALRIWFVWHALVPVIRGSQKVTVALYEWAVSRFGIREEFVAGRPDLSLQQLETRRGRPEWAVRVVAATGKTLVRLADGRVFEPGGVGVRNTTDHGQWTNHNGQRTTIYELRIAG